MSNTPEMSVKTLKSMPEYKEMFAKAFPENNARVKSASVIR